MCLISSCGDSVFALCGRDGPCISARFFSGLMMLFSRGCDNWSKLLFAFWSY